MKTQRYNLSTEGTIANNINNKAASQQNEKIYQTKTRMGKLDRNKSPAVLSKTSLMQSSDGLTTPSSAGMRQQQFSNAAHLKTNGNKKSTYSFLNNNNVEVSFCCVVFHFRFHIFYFVYYPSFNYNRILFIYF